jgi:hypothetical protein
MRDTDLSVSSLVLSLSGFSIGQCWFHGMSWEVFALLLFSGEDWGKLVVFLLTLVGRIHQ